MAEIIWNPDALVDLDMIRLVASRFSGSFAAAITERIYVAVDLLSEFPEIGRVVPGFRSRDLRQLIVRSHLVVYRFTGNEVRILAILGVVKPCWNLTSSSLCPTLSAYFLNGATNIGNS